jgi:predicted DCC family thiol-disulfide oxidoreductase YuxK
MKTLQNHTLIYDNDCPLCSLYTGAFVKTGMLDQNGRVAFSEGIDSVACKSVDKNRSRNEIALVDKQNGEVIYGVDSLLKVIGNNWPKFNRFFKQQIPYAVASTAYSFISYNRKVIIPAAPAPDGHSCTPDFNLKYRLLFLLFTWIITSFILNAYAATLAPLLPVGSFYREFAICGGQILVQGAVITFLNRPKRMEYLGNMMTVSFAGGLLLWIARPLISSITTSPFAFTGWFIIVVSWMLLEHMRRVRLLQIHPIITVSWVLYRMSVLTYLLYAAK